MQEGGSFWATFGGAAGAPEARGRRRQRGGGRLGAVGGGCLTLGSGRFSGGGFKERETEGKPKRQSTVRSCSQV